jgi:penicillin-binding protein 1C
VGFTSRYTVGVWVGNFSGAPMHDVSGVTGAAPIWRDVVHRLHRDLPSARPAAPTGLIAQQVAFEPPVESARREWFVRGTETSVVRLAASASDVESGPVPQIRYPAPDTVIALDPDIPSQHQRVAFVSTASGHDVAWRLNGETLGEHGGRVLWAPTPGRHVLALLDARGIEVSTVAFEVRGVNADARRASP